MSNQASPTAVLGGHTPGAAGARSVTAALAFWLAAVLALGAADAFSRPAGSLPLPVFAGVTVPLAAFALALRASPAFRAFVLALDLRLAAALQAWRFAGLGFIALYANHVLPGLFAWPAGLGDMAVAIAAPWMVVKLAEDPAVARSSAFRLWNVLGIVDLTVAVGTATVCSLSIGAAGAASIGPMARLPLVLIPAFLVPLFVMLHIAALLQARAKGA